MQYNALAICRWTRLLALALCAALAAITAGGQQPDESLEGFMRGIRTNAVKGNVVYQRKEGKFNVEPGLKFDDGDIIMSSSNSFSELLLQPGNYLRVAGDTEFQIISDQHDRMKLKLSQGSISVEILARDVPNSFYYSPDQGNELIRVITPNGQVFITRPGIFRINASAERTELIARDGEALIDGRRVKEKRRGIAAGGQVTINDIDSKIEDSLDAWGRERARNLVQANKQLKKEAPWNTKRKENVRPSLDVPADDDPNKRGLVISAKPGTVSFVETGVEFARGTESWQELTSTSKLEDGNRVRTGTTSFAELVIFPDMHLRIAEASEILLEQLSTDAVSIKVLRGSAILDVARFDKKHLPRLVIGGQKTSVTIADDGNYRIDAPNDAVTVRDGKVTFGERSVGSCHKISVGSVSDCNKHADNFDFWSEHRGEGELYNGRALVSMSSYLNRVRRFRFRNTGFWFQQPGQTSYTFVPFSSLRLHSPYGGNYSTVLSTSQAPLTRVDPSPRTIRRQGPQIMRPQPESKP